MNIVRIVAQARKRKGVVVLRALGTKLRYEVSPTFGTELEAAYYGFCRELRELGYTIDFQRPNLYAAFLASRKPIPKLIERAPTDTVPVIHKMAPAPKPPPRPQEVDFEMNLIEPLEGWKSWSFDAKLGIIYSNFGHRAWNPDEPFAASCDQNCKKIPAEHHSCGIYAATFRNEAHSPDDDDDENMVLGKVLGWGRYIRGTDGWRSEFAYPKCFYLKSSQPGFAAALEAYHVPIYINRPTEIYNPEEDGYEHWGNQEDRNFRAGTESHAGQADDDAEED